jgi:hypothetical protein
MTIMTTFRWYCDNGTNLIIIIIIIIIIGTSNIIGRYIVSQKNIISRIITTTSTNSRSSTTNISRQIAKLRKRLWDVEQLATIAIPRRYDVIHPRH